MSLLIIVQQIREILEWAEKNNVDDVLTFTISGVLTAAYICEQLNDNDIKRTIEIIKL